MVYGLLRALPGARALWPPSSAFLSANLTPASGCQDHTTSPSASTPFVIGASASTASRPAAVTIATRPSVGRDQITILLVQIAVKGFSDKSKIIFEIQNPSFRGSSRRSGLWPSCWRESPESIATSWGYGFRACRLRSAIADRRRIRERRVGRARLLLGCRTALLFAVRRSERAVPSAASVSRHRAVTRIG